MSGTGSTSTTKKKRKKVTTQCKDCIVKRVRSGEYDDIVTTVAIRDKEGRIRHVPVLNESLKKRTASTGFMWTQRGNGR